MARRVRPQTPPPLRPPLTEAEHRRLALLSGDVAQVRAWARRWRVPLLPCSDADLRASLHAARLRDATIPGAARLASAVWLAARGDDVGRLTLEQLRRDADPATLRRIGVPVTAEDWALMRATLAAAEAETRAGKGA